MWSLKYNTNKLIYESEIDLWLPRGWVGKGRTGSFGSEDADYYIQNG